MIYGFMFATIILAGVMISTINLIHHIKLKVRSGIQFILLISCLSNVFMLVAMFTGNENVSRLFFGLYFFMANLHLLAMLYIAESYDVVYKNRKAFRIVTTILLFTDVVFLGGNAFFKYAIDVETRVLDQNLFYNVYKMHMPLMFVHLCIYYVLVAMLVVALSVKTFKTVKLYRRKYMVLLVSILVTFFSSFILSFANITVDLSGILYALLSFAIAIFLLYLVPRAEAEDVVSYSLNGIGNGMICFNKDNVCVYINEVAKELFHLIDSNQKIEDNFKIWLETREPEMIPEQTFREEKVIDGEVIHYMTKFQPLFDDTKHYVGCVFSLYNRTEEERELEAERERAENDALTGIWNREGFFARVRELIDKDQETKRYLICTDIKDFKTYNALFGEKLGDEVLIKAASILKESYGENYIVGRLVSDRFAICIPATDYDEQFLIRKMKEICACVKSDVFRLHMHAGIYTIHDYSMQISVMCDHAYLAVRKIKDDYGEMIAWYDSALGADHRNSKIMIGEFDKALEESQFQMFLQPQLSVDEKIIGAEALVRWMHPAKGLIPPIDFIPVFERAGLIHRLDQFIWRAACSKLAAWRNEGRDDLYISVNISPLDFYYVDIYEYITRLVAEYKINPKNLKLEITETAIVNEATDNLLVIEKLRSAGFEVEIDDFGSGYSSLNTLKDIDVDAIKLDRIFLKETSHKEKSRVIMNNTIAMSKALGIKIVSEGVETKEQVEYLIGAGTDVFQGYYYDRPMSVPAFEEKYLQI